VDKNFVVLDIFLWDIYRDPPPQFVFKYPKAGCQISTLIFEKKLWRRGLYKYPMNNISRTAKFLRIFG
jgi:hypothetical protein